MRLISTTVCSRNDLGSPTRKAMRPTTTRTYVGHWIPYAMLCWPCRRTGSTEASCGRPRLPHRDLQHATHLYLYLGTQQRYEYNMNIFARFFSLLCWVGLGWFPKLGADQKLIWNFGWEMSAWKSEEIGECLCPDTVASNGRVTSQ
jgi:hypothetical protein